MPIYVKNRLIITETPGEAGDMARLNGVILRHRDGSLIEKFFLDRVSTKQGTWVAAHDRDDAGVLVREGFLTKIPSGTSAFLVMSPPTGTVECTSYSSRWVCPVELHSHDRALLHMFCDANGHPDTYRIDNYRPDLLYEKHGQKAIQAGVLPAAKPALAPSEGNERYPASESSRHTGPLETHRGNPTNISPNMRTKIGEIHFENIPKSGVFAVDFSLFRNLVKLVCSHNKLYEITGLEKCTWLSELDCSHNRLWELPAFQPESRLRKLNCENNAIRDVHVLNNCPELTDVNCSGNQLEVIDLYSNHRMINLSCNRNTIDYIMLGKECVTLRSLTCARNRMVYFSLSRAQLAALEEFDCTENQVEELPNFGRLSHLKHIQCDQNAIQTLAPLRFCTGLVSCSAKKNALRSLDGLQNCRKLEALNVTKNSIVSLTGLEHCRALVYLEVNMNALMSLEGLASGGQLRHLECTNNMLSSLCELEGCAHLHALLCDKNQIESLHGLEACSELMTLNAAHNRIKTLDGLYYCTSLRSLHIYNNMISSFRGLENCRQIYSLLINNNPLTSFDGFPQSQSQAGVVLDLNGCFGAPDIEVPDTLPFQNVKRLTIDLDAVTNPELRAMLENWNPLDRKTSVSTHKPGRPLVTAPIRQSLARLWNTYREQSPPAEAEALIQTLGIGDETYLGKYRESDVARVVLAAAEDTPDPAEARRAFAREYAHGKEQCMSGRVGRMIMSLAELHPDVDPRVPFSTHANDVVDRYLVDGVLDRPRFEEAMLADGYRAEDVDAYFSPSMARLLVTDGHRFQEVEQRLGTSAVRLLVADRYAAEDLESYLAPDLAPTRREGSKVRV